MEIVDNDLISRAGLLEALENDRMIFKSTITVPEALLAQGEHWRRCLDAAPAVDAVEVVRCKDCIYYEKYPDFANVCWNDAGMLHVYDDGFCSYGERRTDGA